MSAELYIKNFHLLKRLNHWITKEKKKLSSPRKQNKKKERWKWSKKNYVMYGSRGSRERREKIDGFLTKIKLGPKQNTFNDNLWRWRSTKMLDFVWLYIHTSKTAHNVVYTQPLVFVRNNFNSLCFFLCVCFVRFYCCCVAVLTQFSVCCFFVRFSSSFARFFTPFTDKQRSTRRISASVKSFGHLLHCQLTRMLPCCSFVEHNASKIFCRRNDHPR